MSETNTNLDIGSMLTEAENNDQDTKLKEYLTKIKEELLSTYNNPSKEFIQSSFNFLEAVKNRKTALETVKDQVSDDTRVKLGRLKDELDIYAEIQSRLGEMDRIRIKSREQDITEENGSTIEIKHYLITKRNADGSFEFRVQSEKETRQNDESGRSYTEKLGTSDTFSDLKDIDKYMYSTKKISAKKEQSVTGTKGVGEKPRIDKKEEQINVDYEKNVKLIFESFLMIDKKDFDEINVVSFIKNINKFKGTEIVDWIDGGYQAQNIKGFRSTEEKQIIELSKRYTENQEFKKNFDKLKDAVDNGTIDNFLKSVRKEGHKIKLADSSYDTKEFDPKNKDFVLNFVSDINGDGKLETKNKDYGVFKKALHYLSFTLVDFEKLQGQNLSETLMQDTLSKKFPDIASFNGLLTRFGIEGITPETTPEQLNTIREKFWSKLIEKMTILGRNGKLAGFDQVLDGTEKEFMQQNLAYEEDLDNKIDKLLDSKDTEIKAKLAELKANYGLENVDSVDDLKRIKELLKGTIKENSDIQWGIFGGVISNNTNPKGGDMLGQIIKALNMGDYKGVLGFYVSKKIYESQNKKGNINIGIANFVPYISANYAITAYNCNTDKMGKAEELKGNYTVVPFLAISPLSFSIGTELNFNDKNRAISEHINITSKIFSKGENAYIKYNEKDGKLAIDKQKIIDEYGISGNPEAIKNLEEVLVKFEGYFNEYKTGDAKLDARLLNHLKTSTVNFVSNELYNKNEGWNISGITIGGLFSLINPASLAAFVGINFQSRDQEFIEVSDGELQANNDKAFNIAINNARDAKSEDLEKVGLKIVEIPRGNKNIKVYEYTGTLRNFYAGNEVKIEEDKQNNKVYISGKIDTILTGTFSDNGSTESFISFNGEKSKKSYGKIISELDGLKLQTRKTTKTEPTTPSSFEITYSNEKFDNKEKIKNLINNLFQSNNNLRYLKSFINFQNSVADMYNAEDGNIADAWSNLTSFISKLPKNKKLLFTNFQNSVTEDSEKEKVMQSILGLTAGDWRIRLFNELHYDKIEDIKENIDIKQKKKLIIWARKERKRLGLKKDFKMSDIKDGKYAVIDSPKIKKAEQNNLIKYFDIEDSKKQKELRKDFDTYSKDYDSKNKVRQQTSKATTEAKNAIVFVNFTQKNGKGKSTFHDVVPMYGTIDLHKGEPVKIENKDYKDGFLNNIPDRVLVSKFDQILAKVKSEPNISNQKYNELVSKLEKIKDAKGEVEFIKSVLKGETNEVDLTGSFDLSFVRWSTCQNAAYMINNMKFFIKIPGASNITTEIETILPKLASASINTPAVTENSSSQFTLSATILRSEQESGNGKSGVKTQGGDKLKGSTNDGGSATLGNGSISGGVVPLTPISTGNDLGI